MRALHVYRRAQREPVLCRYGSTLVFQFVADGVDSVLGDTPLSWRFPRFTEHVVHHALQLRRVILVRKEIIYAGRYRFEYAVERREVERCVVMGTLLASCAPLSFRYHSLSLRFVNQLTACRTPDTCKIGFHRYEFVLAVLLFVVSLRFFPYRMEDDTSACPQRGTLD